MNPWIVYFPEILGSDAVMYFDGRKSQNNVIAETRAACKSGVLLRKNPTIFRLAKTALKNAFSGQEFEVQS